MINVLISLWFPCWIGLQRFEALMSRESMSQNGKSWENWRAMPTNQLWTEVEIWKSSWKMKREWFNQHFMRHELIDPIYLAILLAFPLMPSRFAIFIIESRMPLLFRQNIEIQTEHSERYRLSGWIKHSGKLIKFSLLNEKTLRLCELAVSEFSCKCDANPVCSPCWTWI